MSYRGLGSPLRIVNTNGCIHTPAVISFLDRSCRPWWSGLSGNAVIRIRGRLTVVRDASHLTDFGWVRIDSTDRIAMFSEQLMDYQDDLIKNKVYAKLAVEVRGENHIDVQTDRVRRYTVFLNEALIDFSKSVTVTTNGRVSFHGRVTPRIETLLRDVRRRQDVDRLFPARLTLDVPR